MKLNENIITMWEEMSFKNQKLSVPIVKNELHLNSTEDVKDCLLGLIDVSEQDRLRIADVFRNILKTQN